MKSLSRVPFIALQWIMVLGIVGIVGYRVTRPIVPPERDPDSWTQWSSFTAISYPGITDRGDDRYTTPKLLKEHLGALHEAGYRTVSLEDVARFMDGDAPLPEKALLIIFESGRRDSLIRSTPLLRKHLYQAVMAVPTASGNELSRLYLRPDDIRRVSKLPYWEFASAGHKAFKMMDVDRAGTEGHFLSRYAWKKGAQETEAEYRERLTEDYQAASDRLSQLTGQAPIAYVYPFSDAGQGSLAVRPAALINRNSVKELHRLAFVESDDPLNVRYRNPYQLSYLRVHGSWSGEELIKRLEHADRRTRGLEPPPRAEDWRADQSIVFDDDTIHFNSDGRCLIKGSGGWRNVDAEVSFERMPLARCALYFRFLNQESFIRVVVSDQGLQVQERLGDRMHNLATIPIDASSPAHQLNVILKENRLWMTLDGQAAGGPVAVSPFNVRGRFGLGGEGGIVRVTSCRARPFRGQVKEISNMDELETVDLASTGRVILPWLDASSPAVITDEQRRAALRVAGQGVNLSLLIHHIDQEKNPVEWVMGLKAILKESALGSLVGRLAIDQVDPAWAQAIQEAGFKLSVRLDEAPSNEALQRMHEWKADLVLSEMKPEDASRIGHYLPTYHLVVLNAQADILADPGITTSSPAPEGRLP
jgi:peptidoglycan/xylan/chitin deacetylase (PgdA/CDA1 family)